MAAGAVWTWLAVEGFARLWKYEGTAGGEANAPMVLRQGKYLQDPHGMPALVMCLHPQCPCSRASLEELSKLMAHCQNRLSTTVLVIRPAGAPDGWEQTDLWRSASAIPGVTVVADEQGRESRLLGASTSGQTLLYSAEGRLLFAGGITPSRGHSGDNAGHSFVRSVVLGELESLPEAPVRTPVYGCALFTPLTSSTESEATCCQ